MSRTNQQIIDQALYELGYQSYGATADATDAADALNALNQMMEEWKHAGRDLNWFTQDTLADACPIPKYAERAVVSSLAMDCGALFNVSPSQSLAMKQSEAKRVLTTWLLNAKLDNTDMSHLPMGQGNSGRYDINTDQ